MDETLSLDDLPLEQAARIVSVDWSVLAPVEAKRLRALGLDQGAEIRIAHRGMFAGRDPLALHLGRTVIAVRRVHARAMRVALT